MTKLTARCPLPMHLLTDSRMVELLDSTRSIELHLLEIGDQIIYLLHTGLIVFGQDELWPCTPSRVILSSGSSGIPRFVRVE